MTKENAKDYFICPPLALTTKIFSVFHFQSSSFPPLLFIPSLNHRGQSDCISPQIHSYHVLSESRTTKNNRPTLPYYIWIQGII